MVTDALDSPADRHIDRIVGEVLAARDWDRAALRLLVAADYAAVVEGGGRRGLLLHIDPYEDVEAVLSLDPIPADRVARYSGITTPPGPTGGQR